ncbi:uncharacterized protein BYT42DRAFT_551331 [Radiomyces spectabilis]|uniref:uncharacterized protein n=1 Tax=Radiomyces spectabilis TaxID=64574 RepID=UPI00221F4D9B|nr:uncharacterized protein BYT42DRAFT_551331 [Radiomyces spectabilis]KAI8393519.1 hypothetical protein BYT42DRAFT_551331 [Radiomyces spectabilis]
MALAVVTNNTYLDLKYYTSKATVDHAAKAELQKDLEALGLDLFDFNAFVMRVVSVDHSPDSEYDLSHDHGNKQASKEGDSAFVSNDTTYPTSNPYMFSVPDDTQVYFTDSEHIFFAFTHHLTLFDINARGYVHPVALSYITRDPQKIIMRFDKFMNRFNEISRLMKKGNFSNFILDLKCKLLDLQHTENMLVCNDDSNLVPATRENLSVEAIQQASTVTRLMLDSVETYVNQTMRDNTDTQTHGKLFDTSSARETASLHGESQQTIEPPKDYVPKSIDALYPVAHFERKLRTVAQLCQKPDTKAQSASDPPHPQIPSAHPHRSLAQTKVIPLASIIEEQSVHCANKPKDRSFATAIAHDMYAEAINYLMEIIKDLCQSNVVLDINDEEQAFLDPISSEITIGRMFVMNMENPYPRDLYISPSMQNNLQQNIDLHLRLSEAEKDAFRTPETSGMTEPPLQKHNNVIREQDIFPITPETSQLWPLDNTFATNHTILRTLKKYQHCMHHIIFSLMTGRPVLIIGDDEYKSHIQQVVEALAIFVPGNSRTQHCIVDWFKDGLVTDTELGPMKLMGTAKRNVDPSIYRLEISCLEINLRHHNEGNLITSPLYLEGQWIHDILDAMTYFTEDLAYLAYLRTVFFSMGLKAYVYYHLYLTDHRLPPREIPTDSSCESGASLSNHEISRRWSVRRIMSYLKRIEDRENEQEDYFSSVAPPPSEKLPQHSVARELINEFSDEWGPGTEEDGTLSDENQATITLQTLQQHQRRHQVLSVPNFNCYPKPARRASECSAFSETSDFFDFIYGDLRFDTDDENENLSGDEEESPASSDEEQQKLLETEIHSQQESYEDIGISNLERKGRKLLHDKFNLHGDDQTIVVYLANLTKTI